MLNASLNTPAPAARFRFRDQLRLWEPPRQVVQKLALLSTTRQRLISVYNQLAGPLAEQQGFIDPVLQKQLSKSCQASLIALEKDRKAVEKTIDALVEADPHLSQLFELVTSVPGIGTTTAIEIVIATNEMKTITDPKKMAASAVRLPCRDCSLQLSVGQQRPKSPRCQSTRP